MSKPYVLIAIPTDNSYIHKHMVFSVVKLLSDQRVNSKLILPTHRPIENNRNKIVQDFLKGKFDYLIMMDFDNPPMNNILNLIFLGLDVIGCPTPVWHSQTLGDYPIYWNALREKGDGYLPLQGSECQGLQEVDSIGTGCIILSRKVLLSVQYDKPFERTWDDEGVVIEGSDYYFCRKVRKLGFKIHAHFDYPCMHFNEVELTECMKFFNAFYKKPDEQEKFKELKNKLNFDKFSITKEDFDILSDFCEHEKPKRILDYGAGVSTHLFKQFCFVNTIEESFKIALTFDTVIKEPVGIYDFAFIDGPRGTNKLSREQSVVQAMNHTDCIIMHDTLRQGEQQTIYKHLKNWECEDMKSLRGMHLFRRK